MLTITNGNKTCTVDPTEFYMNDLRPMITSGKPFGKRYWTEPMTLFFNIQDSRSELSQSQMRDFFRYFQPDCELFLKLITKGRHPLVEMSDNPGQYNKRECMYLFQLDTGGEIYLGQHLDKVGITYTK